MELFREDSGAPEHTTGTGSVPELATSGARVAVELCDRIFSPKKSVERRRSRPIVVCSGGDQKYRREPSSRSQPCWVLTTRARIRVRSARRVNVVVENAVHSGVVNEYKRTSADDDWDDQQQLSIKRSDSGRESGSELRKK